MNFAAITTWRGWIYSDRPRGGNFDPSTSDLDFLVEYLPNPEADALDEFFGFKAQLESLFGRKIDLVETRAVRNRYFREELEETKVPVYAA